jgi:uncharacterized membrane protein
MAALMSVDVVSQVTIARPPGEVAAFAADPANAPSWYSRISSVEMLGPAVAEGSRIRFIARFMGRRLDYVYEITDLVPGERMTMRTAEGPFAMETTYTWAPDGEGTLMTLRNRGEPAGFSRLAAPLIAPAMRRANRQDLEALKRLLEQGGPSADG